MTTGNPFRRRAAAALLVLCMAPVHAADDGFETSASLETWAYLTRQQTVGDSLLNPGNRIARLARTQEILEARLNLRIRSDSSEVVLRPRLLRQFNQGDQLAPGAAHNGDAYLSQAFGRFALDDRLTLSAGRELLTWGPANFRSPSNPFYFDAGRTQPLREVTGIDLARLHYTDGKAGAMVGYVAGSGHQSGNADYSHTALLKLDYRGRNYLLSGVAARQRGFGTFLGGFGQATPDDALLLYGEIGSGQRAAELTPAADPWSPPYQLRQPSPRRQTYLLGAAYTLQNGQVLSLEYLHDGHGYAPDEARRYFDRARDASRQPAAASAAALGLALSQAPAPLGRDYLSALWQSNPQEGSLYWRLMVTGNLRDRSSQTTVFVEKNVSRHLSLFAAATANAGRTDSEYGSVLRSTFSVGGKIFVF